MSAVDERTAIGTLFNTGWANRTPVAWPNRPYTPVVGTPYARFSIIRDTSFDTEFGGIVNQSRCVGMVFVQVFGNIGEGDAATLLLADQAADILRKQSLTVATAGRILLRTPNVRAVGEDRGFFQVNVSTPYIFDRVF